MRHASCPRFPQRGNEHCKPADLAGVAGLSLSRLPYPSELPLRPSAAERKRRGRPPRERGGGLQYSAGLESQHPFCASVPPRPGGAGLGQLRGGARSWTHLH